MKTRTAVLALTLLSAVPMFALKPAPKAATAAVQSCSKPASAECCEGGTSCCDASHKHAKAACPTDAKSRQQQRAAGC